ncbi:MAG: N-6 DNA methylase, partial [Candidatus Bathyarchaeia archaeon]
DISIAVLYRDEACEPRYTQATVERYIRSTRFQAKIYYVAREEKTFFPEIKHSDWQELSLDDLYKLIYSSYSLLISYDFIERVVNYMYEKINEISGILTGSDRLTKIIPQLERTISLPQSKTKLEHELRVVKISVLALLNALICHDILASYLKKPNLRKVKEYPDQRDQIIKIWDEILQEDYQPIFKVSLEILKLLPNDGNTKEGIDKLLNSAIHLSHSWSILRHDLMGRIYHFLLMRDIAKYYATYYTSITSATLLSYLVVSLINEAWKSYRWFDLSDLSKFRAVDFACGSGTLLVSLYKSLRYKYLTESFKKNVESSLKDFHQVAIEKMIRGYDVLEYAVHLSATALTLLNPQCQYRDHHLITLPLGKLNGVFKLGSINLLMDLINLAYRKDEIEKFDVVIMNPPFTRSTGTVNLLFGDLPPEDRAPMQAELRRMLNTIDLTGIGQGGLGAIFAGMSLDVLKEGGRIGLVLPRSFLSGVSWEGVRKKMIEKCVIEVIVTSFEAPNQWNFSENTDLSEVLVVARRKLNGESMENKKCLVVNFWKKPQNDWEATSIALKLVELFDTVTVSNGHNVLELGP